MVFLGASEDSELASRLIRIYLNLFKDLVRGTNADSRMLGALLTGLHRAFPFTGPSGNLYVSFVSSIDLCLSIQNLIVV